MKPIIVILTCILALTVTCSAQKQLKPDDVIGEWTGESKCQGNNPYCHDEVVLYHVSRITKETDRVHLASDKLVNGKWESMGDMDFTIDSSKSTLTTEFPIPRTGGHGVLTFAVAGDKMDGTMLIYPENEVGRKIHVERKKSNKQ